MKMDKAYDPVKYEADIYRMWEESGAFKPTYRGSGMVDRGSGKTAKPEPRTTNPQSPFCIIMPPPNANGDLHTGHAMYTVEDILIRYHRMLGQPTLWLPGADHAGIETQVVYERLLEKDGQSRFDLGREQFYADVMAFTQKNKANMENQIRSLGFSCDWSRMKFTLDSDIIAIVYETFKKLHDDGLIYRGNRIVNWCPRCRSGFADIEIKHREQVDPLYYIKYGPFVLATVRPETKFGDTAIAVHPKDERYQKYVGQEIEADGLLGKFKLKVIADSYVNPDFGTGVVKVTPAHDPNDWEMGLRHNLEVKPAIGTDGRLTDLCGKYAGMAVADARVQVAHDLQERGLIDHIDMNYRHAIAIHDRCGTAIEPLVTEQWWLKVEPLVKPAIAAVKNGDIKIIPQRFHKVYTNWLENLRDWNISRQDWWGMRIPVYYNTSGDGAKAPYLITADESEAKAYYGEGEYEAETDIFDTWFSSSQWPFATLMATGDFDQFYPTSVMETGRDILFLWVTRMVMLGLYRTGRVPFKNVYLHGLVNDAHGKKMSKSKGNVINPLQFTAKYGTDALRLALTIGITPGNDGSLGEKKVEAYRNFCNKLWNVARYVLDKIESVESQPFDKLRSGKSKVKSLELSPTSLADKWMLDTLSRATKIVTQSLDSYRFSDAGQAVYALLWDDFADWYVEASKSELNLPVLAAGLETILKLAHPFAPFVTEAIWQQIPWQTTHLITEQWPNMSYSYKPEMEQFESMKEVVIGARGLMADLAVTKPTMLYTDSATIQTNQAIIKRLTGVGELKRVEQGRGVPVSTLHDQCWLDVDAATVTAYRSSLQEKRTDQAHYLAKLDAQLGNKAYVKSAPPAVVAGTKERQAQAKALLSKLDEQIEAIEGKFKVQNPNDK
ncbi:MAG TPA: valine--tRNA ligase [Candidatus Saccharimonadales bacterium]|nr:valine--tRNA ligase [Candidatus Saccharimonadales bacterium]